MSACAYINIYIYSYAYGYMNSYTNILSRSSGGFNVSLRMYLSLYIGMFLSQSSVYMFVLMCVCVYARVYVCVCVNKLPQKVQNITWNHKLCRKNNEDLESGADSRRKKLSWNKDPKRYFPRRCTITLTIHNSHDAP